MDFYCIYIQEAHPEDGWQVPHNVQDDVVFDQPRDMAERVQLAGTCILNLDLAMPTLVDDMANTTDTAYAAVPERLYVIGPQGQVTFQCDPGPFGFDIKGWEAAINALL